MKKIFLLFFLLSLAVNFLASSIVLAQDEDQIIIMDSNQRLGATLDKTGLYTANPKTPAVIAIDIIRIALGFVGLIFFIQIFLSGFQWMTSAGNQEKLKKAKQKITNSIIGLVIILAAYLIATTLNTYLFKALR